MLLLNLTINPYTSLCTWLFQLLLLNLTCTVMRDLASCIWQISFFCFFLVCLFAWLTASLLILPVLADHSLPICLAQRKDWNNFPESLGLWCFSSLFYGFFLFLCLHKASMDNLTWSNRAATLSCPYGLHKVSMDNLTWCLNRADTWPCPYGLHKVSMDNLTYDGSLQASFQLELSVRLLKLNCILPVYTPHAMSISNAHGSH